MKKFLFTLVLLLSAGAVSADNEYLLFQYDAAGNRISRTVQSIQPRQVPQKDLPSVNVTVSPTITSDIVTISTAVDVEQNHLQYTLFSVQGNVLVTSGITSQQTQLSLDQYANGIYLLTVTSNTFMETYKIIKQ